LFAGCAASAPEAQRPTPAPASSSPGATGNPPSSFQGERCRRAWEAMVERQRQQEGGADAFLDRCRRLILVAQCNDGWIEYGDNWRFCREHGGLRVYFVIPDG
jgi:hypothetical protein